MGTKQHFDDELTKLIQASDLEPRDFIELFVFAMARVIYCANHAHVTPMAVEDYVVPILGNTIAGAVLDKIKFLEACQIAERQHGSIN